MSKRSKNHHYVPKVLQRQFLAEGERVWYSKRGEDGKYCAPYLKNIKKAFVGRDYYTVFDGCEYSDIVETAFYGRIDDYLGRILPKVINHLENGIIPIFENESLTSLRWAVVEMTKRTPDFTKKIDEEAIGLEIFEGALADRPFESENASNQEKAATLADPTITKKLGRAVRVRATIARSAKIEKVLEEFSIRWSVSKTQHSYILSSSMAYQIGNGGSNGLAKPRAEIWMPVSPKIALVLVRDPARKIPLKVPDTPHHIRQVNEFAARSSDQIASHNQNLIESILGKKAVLK